MRWLAVVALLACGCRQILGLDSPSLAVDAAVDSRPLDSSAAPICIGAPLEVCVPATIPPMLTAVATGGINTDGTCIVDPAHPTWCIVAAVDVTITTTFHATGSKPLVIVATHDLQIDSDGVVDVSSGGPFTNAVPGAGANSTDCGTAGAGVTSTLGGGGGAGGSFGTRGGGGGKGDLGGNNGGQSASLGTMNTVTTLRGGCPGGAGGTASPDGTATVGAGGGAVYLVAGNALKIAGTVNASGGGGQGGRISKGGGSGGGSGGMILLFGASIELSGQLFANGGGGGGGADNGTPGSNGSVSPSYSSAALGGLGGSSGGADCTTGPGCGGSGSLLSGGGQNGDPDDTGAGGGGGGGGAGVIHVVSAQSISGNISPPPR